MNPFRSPGVLFNDQFSITNKIKKTIYSFPLLSLTMSSDALFYTLPRKTRNRINLALKSATSDSVNLENSHLAGGFVREQDGLGGGGFVRGEEQAGGFVRDDVPSTSAGGFIVDEDDDDDDDRDDDESNVPAHISLSKIPSALQALDLAPDDDEVLAVFRNAATGWTSSSSSNKIGRHDDMEDGGEQFVSRDDWRSVCAVLLEHDSGGGGEEASGDDDDGDVDMVDPSGESDDEYHSEDEEREDEGDDDDDDEYIAGPSTSSTRRRTRQTTRKSISLSLSPSPPSPNSKDPKHSKITSRQRKTCIDAYALIFPSVPTEELHAQKIMIRDIQRVAKLLNEKLKTEDVRWFFLFVGVSFNVIAHKMVEMLETFSTSPDKSMSFEDFCRMMVVAKLA
jgi:hypothetical protein